jgi:hypothetical protein
MIVKKSWNDISVEEWLDLERLKSNEYTFWVYQLERLSILCEVDSDDDYFDDLDIEDINELIKEAAFLDTPPNKNHKTEIAEYKLINLNKITNGEWIDLDTYLTKDFLNNYTKILSILYRKIKVNEWGYVEYEPYNYDINTRSLDFEFININEVYGVIEYLLDWRSNILNNYKSILIGDDGEELDEEEKEGLSEADIKEIEEDLKKEKVKKDFSWLKFIYDLSDGDITKMKDVLNTSFILTMNTQMMLNVYKL